LLESLAQPADPFEKSPVGGKRERRRGQRVEPTDGLGIVAGDRTRGGIGERRGEPDADGRLPLLVEVGGRLEQLAEDDLDPRFLTRLATGGIPHFLAPLDEPAGQATLSRSDLPGPPPDEVHPPPGG